MDFGINLIIKNHFLGGELSVGQLICGALFSYDPLSNWLACVALSYGLVENPAQQENMLRVQLTTLRVQYAAVYSDKPFTLLQHCCLLLQSVIILNDFKK